MKLLWGSYEVESDIYGLLYFDLEWAEELAFRIEDIGTLICFACGMLIMLAPMVGGCLAAKSTTLDRTSTALQIVCLIWIALWQMTISTLHAYRGGGFMAEWSIAAHATRIFSPLALMALLCVRSESNSSSPYPIVGDWILRWAIVVTFVTHGVEAIRLNPAFVDLLIGSASNLLWLTLSESVANIMLYIIGAIDVILAGLLIFMRWRWVPAYLAFWGFVTACSRITAAGLIGFASAYPETLIRAANGGAPLALFILCSVLAKPSDTSPATSPPAKMDQDIAP